MDTMITGYFLTIMHFRINQYYDGNSIKFQRVTFSVVLVELKLMTPEIPNITQAR